VHLSPPTNAYMHSDSLYNPSYGYFSHNVTIFTTPEPFDFHSIKSSLDFQSVLGEQYTAFEDALDAKSEEPSDIRQLWHTPTELFKPHYGDAIARYLVENYLLSHHPYHDLIVYELGAGNGTLMLNILDCIRDTYPDVYERTKYRIIEISPALADLQRAKVDKTAEGRGHRGKVEIINKSIFDWDTYVPEPCYVVALEVFDNLAHDAIRYDPYTNAPLQSNVLIDSEGEFYEFYASKLDPVAARFLRVRSAACSAPFNYPLRGPQWVRKFKANLPMSANLTEVEYIPTRLMEFFGVLQEYFPRHGLLASDFSSLPDTVPGINAPVVQTRWKRRTVPVRTPLVHQGYFDILFPTDFAVMEDMYQAMTGKLTRVLSHEEFLRRWAYVEDTEVKNGENPLLEFYKNAAVISTV
jgi:hypothetical protein